MIKDRLNERTLTPQEVRTILKTDNKEIVELCKKAAIRPRKNAKGHTYFSYDEVKNLRKVQAQVNGFVSNPIASKVPAAVGASSSVAGVKNVLSALQDLESRLSDRISKVIDEKLEGMDDVVLELVRCKTENENLKNKVNELNKENFKLKNVLNSFKPLMCGFYIKKEEDTNFML